MAGEKYHTPADQSSLCVLRVPVRLFPQLAGLLWRSGDGKPRPPTPWYRLDGHLCYLYALPKDLAVHLPLERDGVRLEAFDPERDLDQVWGLPPDGFGPVRTIWKPKLHPRPPITLPMAVLRWLLGEPKGRKTPSKDQGRDKGPSPSPEGISGPYSGPKTPPPPVRSIFEILRADEGVARYVYEKLGGQRWRRNAALRLDGHKVVFTFRNGLWLAHCFATGEWFSLDKLAHRLYPDAPSDEAALVWAARDAGRLAPIMEAVAKNATQTLAELLDQYAQKTIPQTRPPGPGVAHKLSLVGAPMKDSLWAWAGVVRTVLQAVCALWVRDGGQGYVTTSASLRFLAGQVGLPYEEVGDALNWLSACGFLAKCGRDVRPGQKGSPPERFAVCVVDTETALKRWQSFGFAPPRAVTGRRLARFWPADEVAKVIRGYHGGSTESVDMPEQAGMKLLVRSTKPTTPVGRPSLGEMAAKPRTSVTRLLAFSTRPHSRVVGNMGVGNDGKEGRQEGAEESRSRAPG